MAGRSFHGTQAGIALAAATAKTVAQIRAAANHGIELLEVEVSGDGTTPTAAPIKVEVLRQTTDGTMTSLTLVKGDDGVDDTLDTTAAHTATSEPTAGDVLWVGRVHPQHGRTWVFDPPLRLKTAGRYGIRCTAASAVNVDVSFRGRE